MLLKTFKYNFAYNSETQTFLDLPYNYGFESYDTGLPIKYIIAASDKQSAIDIVSMVKKTLSQGGYTYAPEFLELLGLHELSCGTRKSCLVWLMPMPRPECSIELEFNDGSGYNNLNTYLNKNYCTIKSILGDDTLNPNKIRFSNPQPETPIYFRYSKLDKTPVDINLFNALRYGILSNFIELPPPIGSKKLNNSPIIRSNNASDSVEYNLWTDFSDTKASYKFTVNYSIDYKFQLYGKIRHIKGVYNKDFPEVCPYDLSNEKDSTPVTYVSKVFTVSVPITYKVSRDLIPGETKRTTGTLIEPTPAPNGGLYYKIQTPQNHNLAVGTYIKLYAQQRNSYIPYPDPRIISLYVGAIPSENTFILYFRGNRHALPGGNIFQSDEIQYEIANNQVAAYPFYKDKMLFNILDNKTGLNSEITMMDPVLSNEELNLWLKDKLIFSIENDTKIQEIIYDFYDFGPCYFDQKDREVYGIVENTYPPQHHQYHGGRFQKDLSKFSPLGKSLGYNGKPASYGRNANRNYNQFESNRRNTTTFNLTQLDFSANSPTTFPGDFQISDIYISSIEFDRKKNNNLIFNKLLSDPEEKDTGWIYS